ncbi:MAG: carboxylesterase family protein, partial [Proteobacteria bacterium]|nr:carboxylesterase family protein [Pseudomonadota bacterium]
DSRKFYEDLSRYGSPLWTVICVDQLARNLRRHDDQPGVYAYLFKWGGASSTTEGTAFYVGAPHAGEIPFFFGDFSYPPFASFTKANKKGRVELSNAMIQYLAQFARSGNPNKPGSDLPTWKPWSNTVGAAKKIVFDADKQNAMIEVSTEETFMKDVMSRINSLPEHLRKATLKASVMSDFDAAEYE